MTILGNIHRHHTGRRVVTAQTSRVRRFGTDFPGWQHPQAADFLLPAEPGLAGTITSVTSEGHAPWTSYSVKFDDGSHTSGLAMGDDIVLIPPADTAHLDIIDERIEIADDEMN